MHLPEAINRYTKLKRLAANGYLLDSGSDRIGSDIHHGTAQTRRHEDLGVWRYDTCQTDRRPMPCGFGDDAGRSIDPLVTAVAIHSDDATTRCWFSGPVPHPRPPTRVQTEVDETLIEQFVHPSYRQPAMMDERLAKDICLEFALQSLGHVLEVTATARACNWAQRLPALRMSTQHLHNVGAQETGLDLGNDDPHEFTG